MRSIWSYISAVTVQAERARNEISRARIRDTRGRGGRAVYSPGCGGCYLNRNRNSRSVLGIGYAIAGVRAAHMNQIRDGRRVSYRADREGREEKERGCWLFVIDFFDVRKNKSGLMHTYGGGERIRE